VLAVYSEPVSYYPTVEKIYKIATLRSLPLKDVIRLKILELLENN
jgi:hypothetical protein